ncbi:MAG: hypothetical protein IPM17_12485 [Verrucomicrobia bacterium]|nr:hypothetical protein [Verrucomicrobiota bacterium]
MVRNCRIPNESSAIEYRVRAAFQPQPMRGRLRVTAATSTGGRIHRWRPEATEWKLEARHVAPRMTLPEPASLKPKFP